MCYACTQCGKCGKFDEDSPLFRPLHMPCLQCGGLVNLKTGICTECGKLVFAPLGKRQPRK